MYSVNVTKVSFHGHLFAVRSDSFVVPWNVTELSSLAFHIVEVDGSSRQSSSMICVEFHQTGMNLSKVDYGSSFARRHRCNDFVDSTHSDSLYFPERKRTCTQIHPSTLSR